MEIADILVVNKSDKPEAKQTVRALQVVVGQSAVAGHHGPAQAAAEMAEFVPEWRVPILQTSALDNLGLETLVETIADHRRFLQESGQWDALRRRHARAEIEGWLQRHLLLLLEARIGPARMEAAVGAVLGRERDPATVAGELLRSVGELPEEGEG